MKPTVLTTAARLDDEGEMRAFLAAIPHADGLSALLRRLEPVSTRAYEDETQTARFIESDGRRVLCFTVAGVTIDQAEMIELRRETLPGVDEGVFQRVVDEALDPL